MQHPKYFMQAQNGSNFEVKIWQIESWTGEHMSVLQSTKRDSEAHT